MSTSPKYNYSGLTSAELWQQIRTRQKLGVGKFEGITDKSPNDDMVNALIANDEERQSTEQVLPEGTSKLPKLARAEYVRQPMPGIPTPDKFRHGHARRDFSHIGVPDPANPKKQIFPKLKDGETFAVCKHEPDSYGRTVTCMNSVHTWQGTETEFRQFFTSIELPDLTVKAPADKADENETE
jgi:hypothetical protein